jgi:hypothetical protein
MRRAGAALCAALCIARAEPAAAACLTVVARPEGTTLASVEATGGFRIAYVHSVTRTPVVETYRVDADAFVQTGIRFIEHGPGLPTQSDEGGRFVRVGDAFVMTMQRRFDTIAMRVHADQSPVLVAGDRSLQLAAWGNRSLALVRPPSCAAH